MIDQANLQVPARFFDILRATEENGFTMPSDILTGSLLRTLAASKPNGHFLELGTGTGLSAAWILDGMDKGSTLISLDNDATLLTIAERFVGKDPRLDLVHCDGAAWIAKNFEKKFDYIFADTWHGKYLLLPEVLAMLRKGGLYIVDDMLPQPNWPDGHQEKAIQFVKLLESRPDLVLTKMHWATGIIIAVKK